MEGEGTHEAALKVHDALRLEARRGGGSTHRCLDTRVVQLRIELKEKARVVGPEACPLASHETAAIHGRESSRERRGPGQDVAAVVVAAIIPEMEAPREMVGGGGDAWTV